LASTTSRSNDHQTSGIEPLRSKVSGHIKKGGFYQDGRFATLLEVVEHYNSVMGTNLTEQQKADLVEYLKSL
jgi:hypothetical protein